MTDEEKDLVEKEKKLAKAVWTQTSIAPPIWVCEDSTLRGNGLVYPYGMSSQAVVRLPVEFMSNLQTEGTKGGSLSWWSNFKAVRNEKFDDNEIMWWEFHRDGITFKVFND